jgi:hypothetical protein
VFLQAMPKGIPVESQIGALRPGFAGERGNLNVAPHSPSDHNGADGYPILDTLHAHQLLASK